MSLGTPWWVESQILLKPGLPTTGQPLQRQRWARVTFRSKRYGVTWLDAMIIQTFPSHRIIQEFSLHRLAPFLLVTKESGVISCSLLYVNDVQMVFWSALVICIYWATPRRAVVRTLNWESGVHPQWSSRASASVWLWDPLFTAWPQKAFLSGLSCTHPFCSLTLTCSPLSTPHTHVLSHHINSITLPGIYLFALCSLGLAR